MTDKSRLVLCVRCVLCVLCVLCGTAVGDAGAQTPHPSVQVTPGRSTVYASRGVVATSQPLASQAAVAVLERGGNAIDAAVTAAAMLSVVEPHMTGIGGDVFAIVWVAKEKKLVALNATGRSGSLLTREELVKRGRTSMPLFGPEPITVPGALSGWSALLERYGTMSLAKTLEPAIRVAEDGFPVTRVIAQEWAMEVDRSLQRDSAARATFLVGGTRAPRAGEWFRNPDYAKTLRLIAREGPKVMYGGALGRRIADHVRSLGGFLTPEDFARHRAEWVTPISATFKGHRVYEMPPNSWGIAALEMLRILEPYDLAAMGHNSAPYLHHIIEAKKLTYADVERYTGDPAGMTVAADKLLTDGYIETRRQRIDPARASEQVEPGDAAARGETIYLTAADAEGNMVSLINSQYWEFGSGVMVPGTGFTLQDRGAGFTLTEGRANTVGPNKRPLHTLMPAFVTRVGSSGAEEPWLSFGVMGGAMQPQGHVQLLLNLLVFGMDLQQAVDAPRMRHMSRRRVALEPGIGDAARRALVAMGHEISTDTTTAFGGAQAIMRLGKGWAAASDPRKDGQAVAY